MYFGILEDSTCIEISEWLTSQVKESHEYKDMNNSRRVKESRLILWFHSVYVCQVVTASFAFPDLLEIFPPTRDITSTKSSSRSNGRIFRTFSLRTCKNLFVTLVNCLRLSNLAAVSLRIPATWEIAPHPGEYLVRCLTAELLSTQTFG